MIPSLAALWIFSKIQANSFAFAVCKEHPSVSPKDVLHSFPPALFCAEAEKIFPYASAAHVLNQKMPRSGKRAQAYAMPALFPLIFSHFYRCGKSQSSFHPRRSTKAFSSARRNIKTFSSAYRKKIAAYWAPYAISYDVEESQDEPFSTASQAACVPRKVTFVTLLLSVKALRPIEVRLAGKVMDSRSLQ